MDAEISGKGHLERHVQPEVNGYYEQSYQRGFQIEASPSFITVPNLVRAKDLWDSKPPQLPLPPGMSFSGHLNTLPRPWRPFGSYSISRLSNVTMGTSMDFPEAIPSISNVTTGDPSPGYHSVQSDGAPMHFSENSAPCFNSLPYRSRTDPNERRIRSQERNRIAAMKSRQRKKREWERLIDSEATLLQENIKLKEEVLRLREELRRLTNDIQ